MNTIKFHWSSEIYGLGRAYRYVYNIPKLFPLPFFSDHGVIPSGVIDEAIPNTPIVNKTFFTFSSSIIKKRDQFTNLRIIGQIHPWVIYKEKKSIERNASPAKVIFFPLHTVEGYEVEGMNDQESVNFLKQLDEPEINIFICLHWNDLNSSRESFFKNMGFQVISFGDPMGDDFIDKFYGYARDTKYAISESWTSGLAFLVDMSIPCQIIPRIVQIRSNSELNRNVGFSNHEVLVDIQESEKMFAELLPEVSDDQKKFVQNHLGYRFRDNLGANKKIIIALFFTSLPSWIFHKIKQRFYMIIRLPKT